jgi:SAM-dependent methyltransferase
VTVNSKPHERRTMGDQLGVTIRRLIPEPLKPALRTVRRIPRTVVASFGTPLRVRAYRSPGSLWLRVFPAPLRRRWRLEPPSPGSRRIEIGSGLKPQPGYVHVDVDPDSRSVDLLVSGRSLPLSDGWSDEVLSIHMIEHVPPPRLRATLREWFRVLRDGGMVRIHTPNGEALGRALVESASGARNPFWAVQSAIFGYGPPPDYCTGPERLSERGDHRMVFTFPILRDLLQEAGFSGVEDVSGEDPCYHSLDWEQYVPGLCLEVRAKKNEGNSGRR